MILPDGFKADEHVESDQEDRMPKGLDPTGNSLMQVPVDTDQEQEGQIANDMLNQGISSFQPDRMFDQMSSNMDQAKKQFGESLLCAATGYDMKTLERNVKLPEFKREIQKKLKQTSWNLENAGVTDEHGNLTKKAVEFASAHLFMQELDILESHGFQGDHKSNEISHYGERADARPYRAGDTFKDISLRKSIHMAIRRGHKTIKGTDWRVSQRQSRGKVSLVYAIDASGSMKGKKIEAAKRAGVGLAYKAMQQNDTVGLLVFADEVRAKLEPSDDFVQFLHTVTEVSAYQQTNITQTIQQATPLFTDNSGTKHLIIITDAEVTVGDNPQRDAIEGAAAAAAEGISVTIVGIQLEEDAKEFAKKLTEVGNGKFYVVQNIEDLDRMVLSDYSLIKND